MKAAQMAALEHMTGDVYRVGCDIERELNEAKELQRPQTEGVRMKDSFAFIYLHAFNGMVRVESLDTARNISGNPEWKHVATINPHVVLESILRATIKERNLIIKHLLT
jgi:hypothetical protein